MSTTPLTDAINALTTYSNETTGESDTTLSAAVATLIAGYGGGGGYDINDIADGSEPSGAITISTATSINDYAFAGRSAITGVTAPSVTSLGQHAFDGCSGITSVSFPALTTLNGVSGFSGCRALTTIALPSITSTLQQYTFYYCNNLTAVDLGSCSSIINGSMNGCSSLTTLILRKSSVVTLANVGAFSGTPFASGGSGGTIYVPSDLISSYQSASNWSTLHGYGTVTWTAIEGSQYETQYADGTAIS